MPCFYYENSDRKLYSCIIIGFTNIDLGEPSFRDSYKDKISAYEDTYLEGNKYCVIDISQLHSFSQRYPIAILGASNDKNFLDSNLNITIGMFNLDSDVPGFIDRSEGIEEFLEDYVNHVF